MAYSAARRSNDDFICFGASFSGNAFASRNSNGSSQQKQNPNGFSLKINISVKIGVRLLKY